MTKSHLARQITGSLLLGLCTLLVSARARSDSGAAGSAAAEALFDDGVRLMESEHYTEACEKFRASHELEPQLGTLLRLADCFDRTGKTASAWALFKQAASTAKLRDQLDRERIASARAADLEGRLSRLWLRIAADDQPAGLELKLNGIKVPAATWNTAVPVDPGLQNVEASAPGFRTWAGSVDVPAGAGETSLEVPRLQVEPREPVLDRSPAPQRERPSSLQSTIGFISVGVGAAALLAGGVLAYRASELNDDSLAHCASDDANACTARGVELREDALAHARLATYPVVAGALLVAGGATLIFTAPSSRSDSARQSRLTASVSPWPAHLNLSLESQW